MNKQQITNQVSKCLYSVTECDYTVDHVRYPQAGRTVALRRRDRFANTFNLTCSDGAQITELNDLNEDEVYEQVQKFMDAPEPPLRGHAAKELEVGDQIEYWVNQGWREAEVLAGYKDLKLIAYVMPAGRVSMVVVQHNPKLARSGTTGGYTGAYRGWWNHGESEIRGYAYESKHSVSVKAMPGYWRGAVTAEHGTLVENVLDSLGLGD